LTLDDYILKFIYVLLKSLQLALSVMSHYLSSLIFLLVSGIAVGAGITAALTVIVKRLALKFQWVDVPNQRSMHTNPVPRLGGVAIVGGFFATMVYFLSLSSLAPETFGFVKLPSPWILIGAVIMALTGLYDDLFNMKPRSKLAFQAIVASMLIFAGFRFQIPFVDVSSWGLWGDFLLVTITFFWVIGIINALNLLDGLDGLAAGVAAIAALSLAAVMAISGGGMDVAFIGAFLGALIGFLLHNSHPASIFMGDSGSLFLGFMLAAFALPVTGEVHVGLAFLIPVLALGLPILDTTVAIFRRAAQGKGLFCADRDHIHHRIRARLGFSHQGTVFVLYGMSIVFGLSSVLLAFTTGIPVIALGLGLTGAFVLFFLVKLGYIVPSLSYAHQAESSDDVATSHVEVRR
jgi:UDP-GlcNAc:undecaprenyl-phosphate/decaprenyl-phosphate GlcNAc-1-phosphate transferase